MDKKLIFNEHGDRGTQSMIGGNTTNLREWNRIKYDWANQMYRTMLNNFWIPEEISLNEDVKQFPYLTDYERRAFDKIIAFLNFLDSIQSENLPNLSRYITASECSIPFEHSNVPRGNSRSKLFLHFGHCNEPYYT